MEKRVNGKLELYITDFKQNVCEKIKSMDISSSMQNELLEFVYDYDRLCLSKEDFIKRKRIKNAIPTSNRCTAKRANGEQCTRRRKEECEFCGTHEKARPHGLIESDTTNMDKIKKVEVIAREVMGIVYYLDQCGNVYDTEDVMDNLPNPKIIAKYVLQNDKYTIPSLGLV